MFSHKTLICHLDDCIKQLENLIQDERKKKFSDQHEKESKLIKEYKNSLEKIKADFHLTTEHITKGLNLEKHPEGGFYREFIRTNDETVIFYLLPKEAVSSWHSLKDTQETFKLISGNPLIIHKIDPKGNWKSVEEVNNEKNVIIEKKPDEFSDWFGAYTDGEYGFVTCTCKGPFEFKKFKLATEADLNKFHSENIVRRDIITKLSPKNSVGKNEEEPTPLISSPTNR